jgi:hypothetical protein
MSKGALTTWLTDKAPVLVKELMVHMGDKVNEKILLLGGRTSVQKTAIKASGIVDDFADALFKDKVHFGRAASAPHIVSTPPKIYDPEDEKVVSKLNKAAQRKKQYEEKRKGRERFNVPVFDNTEDESFLDTVCKTFGKLKYGGEGMLNTCYKDSVIMLLYTVFEEFTQEFIFSKSEFEKPVCMGKDEQQDREARAKLGKALDFYHRTLANGTRKVTTCSALKTMLSDCVIKGFEDFSTNSMRDPYEFLSYLFTVFEVECATVYTKDIGRRRLDKVWDENNTTTYVNHNASPLYLVPADELVDGKPVSAYLDYTVESQISYGRMIDGQYEYDAKLKRSMFFDGEVFILACGRATLEGSLNLAKVVLEDTIILPGSGKQLKLVGVVIFDDNAKHYTSVLRCGNRWYHYDDLRVTEDHLGDKVANSVEQLNKWNNGVVCTKGTLYFYK